MSSKPGSRTAAPLIPLRPTIGKLRAAAAKCTACPLYADATQAVFGEGPVPAGLMLIGETPGDQEDRVGRPFVGPAGKLLDRCLEEVGIARDEAYVTNAVKHFKWEPRGKRRLHKKPNALEIAACKPWVEAEIALVKPKVVVVLGATAAKALLGATFRVSRERGRVIRAELAPYVMATVHPSSLLRAPDDATRHREIARFVVELRHAAAALKKAS
ncbi:MAG TPA: UdgX family uracil-DNA binding protein [Stellaceae bacterium]|nr:UdgX family uracil-DNA binding protein [Stellaceae bacterium]